MACHKIEKTIVRENTPIADSYVGSKTVEYCTVEGNDASFTYKGKRFGPYGCQLVGGCDENFVREISRYSVNALEAATAKALQAVIHKGEKTACEYFFLHSVFAIGSGGKLNNPATITIKAKGLVCVKKTEL